MPATAVVGGAEATVLPVGVEATPLLCCAVDVGEAGPADVRGRAGVDVEATAVLCTTGVGMAFDWSHDTSTRVNEPTTTTSRARADRPLLTCMEVRPARSLRGFNSEMLVGERRGTIWPAYSVAGPPPAEVASH